MSNRVVHFEIPTNEPTKTIQFFKEVFEWSFQQFGNEEYWLIKTGDESLPRINGGLMKRRDPKQPIVNSIDVQDIDKVLTRITEAGGAIVVQKMPIPNVGWLAYFTDPDGTIHGVYQDDKSAN